MLEYWNAGMIKTEVRDRDVGGQMNSSRRSTGDRYRCWIITANMAFASLREKALLRTKAIKISRVPERVVRQ